MVGISVALFAVAAAAGPLADQTLTNGPGPSVGPVELRLVYNSGVAFGLGNTLPGWLITVATGAVIVAIGAYAWRAAPATTVVGRVGFAAIMAGALANFVDRAMDGEVTDYLHTGWFPTFNLADVYITCGAVALALTTLWSGREPDQHRKPNNPE